MRVYFDTEFTGLRQRTTLVSIGLVTDDGRAFYAELDDYDRGQVDAWVRDNVIDHLLGSSRTGALPPISDAAPDAPPVVLVGRPRGEVAAALGDWLESLGGPVQMWSDVLAYDWVLFRDLWSDSPGGGPPGCVSYIPLDLATLLHVHGLDPDLDREEYAGLAVAPGWPKHNALRDALVIRACVRRVEREAAR